jgi:hypothetical protein
LIDIDIELILPLRCHYAIIAAAIIFDIDTID